MEPGFRRQGLRRGQPEGARHGRLLRGPLLPGGKAPGDRPLLSEGCRGNRPAVPEARKDSPPRVQERPPVERFCYDKATNETDIMKMSEMALKTVDQRVSPRVPVGTPASLRWGEERISGEIESINLNGMYVNSPR